MLSILTRYQRTIAWLLTGIIYLELVLVPVQVRAASDVIAKLPVARPVLLAGAVRTKTTSHPVAASTAGVAGIQLSASTAAVVDRSPVLAPAAPDVSAAAPEGTFTTGPTQPEMQSFQSVNASNMVDLFTGDFAYNIPLLDVGGYPVNIGYSSGITMEQEASWVGLGWNINPGTITRNMRGLPDDFMGDQDKVTKTMHIRENKTVGVTAGANAELFGVSQLTKITEKSGDAMLIKGRPGVLGLSLGLFHNTYKGWGTEFGLNASINAGTGAKGPLTGNLSITNNSQNGLDVSPSMGFRIAKDEGILRGDVSAGTNFNSRVGIQSLQMTGQVRQHANSYASQIRNFNVPVQSTISFSRPSYTPTIQLPTTSSQNAFTAKIGLEQWAFHPNFYVRGYISKQTVEDEDTMRSMPAYGYLYYEQAGANRDVLLDFNREKDIAYSHNSPHIAVPIYTYDTYSISGEGNGGMFRPYRGDIGYVFDHSMSTKSKSDNFSIDVGVGSVVHAGIDYNNVYANTTSGPWVANNSLKDVTGFRKQEGRFENVYFKNPGEKTAVNQSFLNAIGDDKLVRVDLSPVNGQNHPTVAATRNLSLFENNRKVGSTTLQPGTTRIDRDKRTQVISYLNAREAAEVALDKTIKSYHINAFPLSGCTTNFDLVNRIDQQNSAAARKPHHLSEISVLNADGKRYIYGIPVYNTRQTEVSMAINTGDAEKGLAWYDGTKHNSTKNDQGKDHYYSREQMPPYAHSFLLSGVVSDNYVDLTGDGITEDDAGEAVKFNYSRVRGNSVQDRYRWRAPFAKDSAAYSEGLKTDSRDGRANYTYGEREVWYLNSIESKTMIATFVLETGSVRRDGRGALGENGGIDLNQHLYRLKEINLYAKPDFVKNGPAVAKPIKTVHFEYSYELCPGNPGSAGDSGKLTLKKIWFTYNKNNKGQLNPYVFKYNDKNPVFDAKAVDRWGNYKNAAKNPGGSQPMSNADYPYALQPGANWTVNDAAAHAAPWTLSQVKLPSGGRIEVNYESDDYAFVQNKRAMQFFTIAGFGSDEAGTIQPALHASGKDESDFMYVFANVSSPVANKAEVLQKYLEGVTQLYCKVAVNMPADRWGSGYEYVPCYAEIDNYGVRTGNSSMIWIKVKPIEKGRSPFATAAIQFLRLNLPSKAYKHSEPGDNLDIRAAVNMLATVANNVISSISGFSKFARNQNLCNSVVANRSFVRLDNPVYRKLGGGLRVKRVEVYDNWKDMTANKQVEARYGQDYDYTTTELINGVQTAISSGVASYEPTVGNDENPFRVPHKVYSEKVGALVPVDYMYTEEPFAETFFPSPMVGYSRVRVQTIHKTKKSADGLSETEFYTTRDFPVSVEYTPIDDESKKNFEPKITNVFKFDSKIHVTLSQGFKVELNDMNGKMKAQASYAQTDLTKPMNYTQYYYRLKNDLAARPQLSGKAAIIDSANGKINYNGEIGKDVELMIDVREQISTTTSGSLEVNVDFANIFPPMIFPSAIPLPSKETNMYRAVAVTKVVNRYGIVDSLIHIEKGSKVTTRNLVYDGETGEVLVSQTNNEFDDPVYNLNYPAHWAYEGMGPAYKNIGTTVSNLKAKLGRVYYNNGVDSFPMHQYFKTGDELLILARTLREPFTNDTCNSDFFFFVGGLVYRKVWVVDAARGIEGNRGLQLIDALGNLVSGDIQTAKVIRSGRRNMSSASIGSVTSMVSPIKTVNGVPRLAFDSTAKVIAASAARFKDVWKVDSLLYRKDTVMILKVPAKLDSTYLYINGSFSTIWQGVGAHTMDYIPNTRYFEAYSEDYGDNPDRWDGIRKSFLRFDFSRLDINAIVQNASLELYSTPERLHRNQRNSNSVRLKRTLGPWIGDAIGVSTPPVIQTLLGNYFDEIGNGATENSTMVTMPETLGDSTAQTDVFNLTNMVRNMATDYWSSGVTPGLMMQLVDNTGTKGEGKISRRVYNSGHYNEAAGEPGCNDCLPPAIFVRYYKPCFNGQSPTYQTSPSPGYYCLSEPVDTFICRPLIDTITNPYRTGIWGNWKVDRAYTYYDQREQAAVTNETNIRTDGAIKDFKPFWTFTNNLLYQDADSSRWVWNSEINQLNSKGYERENHDPLNRYNAGQYGYNRTLPVAVTQNSKARNAAFEGFEDYTFRTDTCRTCVQPRFINLQNGGALDNTVSHTGQYSLRIAGNQMGSSVIPLTPTAQDVTEPRISMRVDSVPIVTRAVTPAGTGLMVQYAQRSGSGCNITPNTWQSVSGLHNIAGDAGEGRPFDICPSETFDLRWTGYIQPRYSETYTFYVRCDDRMIVRINGRQITAGRSMETDPTYSSYIATDTISLVAGELYPIEVIFSEDFGNAFFYLNWQSASQINAVVPVNALYSNLAQGNGTLHTDTVWCVKPQKPKPQNVVLENFSPLHGTKLLVSAWVKEEAGCVNGSYLNSSLEVQFNTPIVTTITLRPSGPVIEGWQRIEGLVTVPSSATQATIRLRSLSATPVYFDDVRFHPFNANMKSFVYNPVNIRLMAELDENNYATFYEYDDDGTLIRVKKETERGIKTIKETRSALLKN